MSKYSSMHTENLHSLAWANCVAFRYVFFFLTMTYVQCSLQVVTIILQKCCIQKGNVEIVIILKWHVIIHKLRPRQTDNRGARLLKPPGLPVCKNKSLWSTTNKSNTINKWYISCFNIYYHYILSVKAPKLENMLFLLSLFLPNTCLSLFWQFINSPIFFFSLTQI